MTANLRGESAWRAKRAQPRILAIAETIDETFALKQFTVGGNGEGIYRDHREQYMIPRSPPSPGKPPDIASASVPETLLALHVNPETGLSRADVEGRRKEHGYNEVAEQKGHPVLKFLGKF